MRAAGETRAVRESRRCGTRASGQFAAGRPCLAVAVPPHYSCGVMIGSSVSWNRGGECGDRRSVENEFARRRFPGPVVSEPPHGSHPPAAVAYADRALPAGDRSPEALPDAASRAFAELYARLRPIVGPGGHDALLRRSVSRAAGHHPVLAKGLPEPTPEALVAMIRDQVRPDNAVEFADAVREIIAEQISLLTRLIGEDLVRAILGVEHLQRPEVRAEDEAGRNE
jgi:hypothetical protein